MASLTRCLAAKTLHPDDTIEDRQAKLSIAPVLAVFSVPSFALALRGATDVAEQGPPVMVWFFIAGVLAAYPYISGLLYKRVAEPLKHALYLLWPLVLIMDWLRKGRHDYWLLVIPLTACLLMLRARWVGIRVISIVTGVWILVKTTEDIERFGLYDVLTWNEALPAQGWQWGLSSFLFRLLMFYSTLAVVNLFAANMHRERDALEEAVMVAREVAQALVRFDLEDAQGMVDDALVRIRSKGDNGAVSVEECLLEAFCGLLGNLRVYRPYLPDSLFEGQEEDGEGFLSEEDGDAMEGVQLMKSNTDHGSFKSSHATSRNSSRCASPVADHPVGPGDSPFQQVSPLVLTSEAWVPRRSEMPKVDRVTSEITAGELSVATNPLSKDDKRGSKGSSRASVASKQSWAARTPRDAPLSPRQPAAARRRLQSKIGSRRRASTESGSDRAMSLRGGGVTPSMEEEAAKKRRQLEVGMTARKVSLSHSEADLPAAKLGADTFAAAEKFVVAAIEVAKQFEGTVQSLLANKVTVAWNAHRPCYRHTLHAAQSALAISRRMRLLPRAVRPPWTQVCASTGTMLAGRVGTDTQRAPFVLGDPCVHVQYLSELCRTLHVRVMATEKLYEVVKTQVDGRLIDVVKMPTWPLRRPGPRDDDTVAVYELLNGMPGAALFRTAFLEGFSCLRRHHLERACEMLTELCTETPDDRQALRLLSLATYAKGDGAAKLPRPYCRPYTGWLDFDAPPVTIDSAAMRRRRTCLSDASGGDISEDLSDDGADVEELQLRKEIERARQEAAQQRQLPPECAVSPTSSDSAASLSPQGGDQVKVPPEFVDRKGHRWYRSDKLLGRGAFGEVRLGMGEDGGLVALKGLPLPAAVVDSSQHASPAARRRAMRKAQQSGGASGTAPSGAADELEDLLTEVQLLSTLRHDNIVAYLSSGVFAGCVIIVMEFVSGGSLSSVLEQFGTLPMSSMKRYIKDICRGLRFLHGNDPVIIHRDFKPHNVLLTIDGQCKLADFGASANMAKVSGGKGKVVGTPLYMAPEACRGFIMAASDIWGVGIACYQMFTGSVPYVFTEDNPFIPLQFMYKLGNEESAMPVLDRSLVSDPQGWDFVEQTLRRDPEARPTADELLMHTFLS